MTSIHTIPSAEPADIIAWAEANVKVDGHSFDSTRTPQLIEPIRAMADVETRIGTLVKPVQSGGSTAGEIVLAFWSRYRNGKIQFNWQDDGKARERWKDRILPMLEKLDGLRWAGGFDKTVCEARFLNATLIVQGVIASGALDSETIPLQINEEIHLWDAGNLDKARSRQTLVWNSKALDISNAGVIGDQLHAAYEEGTSEVWEVLCPGCRGHHEMRFRWDDKRPDLGGLRFDSNAGRVAGGKYSLNRVVPTIRYQMPCGYIVHDTPTERRALVGRYRRTNDGALEEKRSWTYEGVSVAEIKWPDLVSEWLKAHKALKNGDGEPLKNFVQRRECRFYGEETIPFTGALVVNNSLTKNRDGLEKRAARLWAADKQRGYKHKAELSHYWLVVRDVLPNCDSQLVFEGKIDNDAELIAVLDDLKCLRYAGGIDASWDTKHVLEFCYRNGLNAFMGNQSRQGWFLHADKVKRFYSEGKTIHGELNMPPRFDYTANGAGYGPSVSEPMAINYNVAGLLANLFFVRDNQKAATANGVNDFIRWDVPSDVTEDYIGQLESWERTAVRQLRTNDEVEGFRKVRQADHMLMCEGYIAMMMDIGGFIAERMTQLGIERNESK
jgi:hypothetical protein